MAERKRSKRLSNLLTASQSVDGQAHPRLPAPYQAALECEYRDTYVLIHSYVPHRQKLTCKGPDRTAIRRSDPFTRPVLFLVPGQQARDGRCESRLRRDLCKCYLFIWSPAPRYASSWKSCPQSGAADIQVFPNDFSALLPTGPAETSSEPPSDLFSTSTALGRCKVICFHPRHDLTLAIMTDKEIESVIEGWKGVYRDEGEFLKSVGEGEGGYVQIFEVRLPSWCTWSKMDNVRPIRGLFDRNVPRGEHIYATCLLRRS